MKIWLADEHQTRQAGAALAAAFVPAAESAPVVVFVRGDLGAGKSTLVRGFLTQAGITGVMPSPTYSLVEPYQTDRIKIFHMDAYRLADATELDYLGLEDIDSPGSILLLEWPDHIREALPEPTLIIDLKMSPHPDSRTSTPAHRQAQLPSIETGKESGRERSPQVSCDSAETLGNSPGHKAAEQVGRLLSVSLSRVPVQLRKSIEASDEWTGLLRVVT